MLARVMSAREGRFFEFALRFILGALADTTMLADRLEGGLIFTMMQGMAIDGVVSYAKSLGVTDRGLE